MDGILHVMEQLGLAHREALAVIEQQRQQIEHLEGALMRLQDAGLGAHDTSVSGGVSPHHGSEPDDGSVPQDRSAQHDGAAREPHVVA